MEEAFNKAVVEINEEYAKKKLAIEKDYASVNIQNLPTGLYHVRIHSDEYVASGKFNKK
jgi:hypothetical protein